MEESISSKMVELDEEEEEEKQRETAVMDNESLPLQGTSGTEVHGSNETQGISEDGADDDDDDYEDDFEVLVIPVLIMC